MNAMSPSVAADPIATAHALAADALADPVFGAILHGTPSLDQMARAIDWAAVRERERAGVAVASAVRVLALARLRRVIGDELGMLKQQGAWLTDAQAAVVAPAGSEQ